MLKFRLKALSAAIAAAAIGVAAPAWSEEDQIEEIVVTGSYIKRSSFEGTKPIQVIDQESIKRSGAAQPVDVLKELTANSGSQFYNETNNRAGTGMFNIRNLGLGSTLALVNGKRAGVAPVADDTGTDFLDINQFPLSMIERIEVLTDGASALYGSQAVAGVANIITRKGFEGFELSGGVSDSVIEQRDLSLASGAQFGNGGFNFYATYYDQDDAYRSDFYWLNYRLNPSPETSRFLAGVGSPGTYRRATLNSAGEAVRVASALPLRDQDCEAAGGVLRSPTDSTCRYLFVDQVSVISAEERVQAFTEFDWEFSDKLRYYAEASYSNNMITRAQGGATFNTGSAGGGLTITADHPFNFYIADPADPRNAIYIGPDNWDEAVHGPQAVALYAASRPLGREVANTDITQFIKREMQYVRILNGLEYDLSDTWSVNASYGWAKSTRTTNGPHNYRADVFNDLVKSGEWNPFGTRLSNPTLVSPRDGTSVAGNSDITLKKLDEVSASNARVLERIIDAVAVGDLFELGGETVKGAFGYQHRDVDVEVYSDSLSAAGEANEESLSGTVIGGQSVWAVFGEIMIPVGDTAEIQLAARREDYGGSIGSTTDPKVAFEWQPIYWLGFRGSWGTSFQAPTVRQTASATSSGFIDDPASFVAGQGLQCVNAGLNNNIVIAVQGSPDLAPQESTNYNLGIVFRFENDLDISADYFNFKYTDLIAQSEGAQAIVNNDCADDGQANDPRVIRDGSGKLRQVNTEFVNIGQVETSGFDMNLRYSIDAGSGTLMLDAAATYVLEFDVSNGGVTFDGAGSRNFGNNFSTLPELRANLGATYLMGGHGITVKFRYIDEYENDQSNNGIVDAWKVFDAQYTYTMNGLIGEGDSSFTIGANNLFDEEPPALTRLDSNGNPRPYQSPSAGGLITDGLADRPGYDDRAGHDLRGRIVYVKFSQGF